MSDLTPSMKRTNEQRVERGARWLDETSPGWFNTVNLELLEMSDSCNCVIGQLVSDVDPNSHFCSVVYDPTYEPTPMTEAELRGVVMTTSKAIQRGFEIDVAVRHAIGGGDVEAEDDYLDMQARWTVKILARRELAKQTAGVA